MNTSLAAAITVIAVGCGIIVGNPDQGKAPEPKAAIQIYLTDAPIDTAKSVFITVSGLAISADGTRWQALPLAAAQEIDLLQLQNGNTIALTSESEISPGDYRVRLQLDPEQPPRIVLADGTEWDLTIASAERAGIKISSTVTVSENDVAKVILDFNVRQSIVEHGDAKSAKADRFTLRPVLRVVREDQADKITGNHDSATVVCVYERKAAIDPKSSCNGAITSAIVRDRRYNASFLPKGDYQVVAYDRAGNRIDEPEHAQSVLPPHRTPSAPSVESQRTPKPHVRRQHSR